MSYQKTIKTAILIFLIFFSHSHSYAQSRLPSGAIVQNIANEKIMLSTLTQSDIVVLTSLSGEDCASCEKQIRLILDYLYDHNLQSKVSYVLIADGRLLRSITGINRIKGLIRKNHWTIPVVFDKKHTVAKSLNMDYGRVSRTVFLRKDGSIIQSVKSNQKINLDDILLPPFN